MNNVVALKGLREVPKSAPKSVKSSTEPVILTQEAVRAWKLPPVQRPLRVNAKVMELAQTLKNNGGIMSGILTIGILNREKFIVDGQHRIEAFKISELPEVYAEVRLCHFDDMAELAEEFVLLNSRLVNMRPDDILRGLESSNPGLQLLRKHCEFVGYDQIRRGTTGPVLSMSTLLRCWFGSAQDVPSSSSAPATQFGKSLTEEDATQIIQFLNVAYGAFGRDQEFGRLWSVLNLSLTMWLWRRTVLSGYSAKSVRLTAQQFGKCLMALSASGDYLEWIVGRKLTDRDRSPCYSRIRGIFAKRLESEIGKRPLFPAPPWFHGQVAAAKI